MRWLENVRLTLWTIQRKTTKNRAGALRIFFIRIASAPLFIWDHLYSIVSNTFEMRLSFSSRISKETFSTTTFSCFKLSGKFQSKIRKRYHNSLSSDSNLVFHSNLQSALFHLPYISSLQSAQSPVSHSHALH